MILYTARAFGLTLGRERATRGVQLAWCGVGLEVDELNKAIMLSPAEGLVAEATMRLQTCTGVVSLRSLKATTGKLSWLTGMVPRCKWAVSMIAGAVLQQEGQIKRARTEPLALAREWLLKLLATQEVWRPRRIPLVEESPGYTLRHWEWARCCQRWTWLC